MHILLIHQAFTAGNEAGGTRHYEMAKYLEKYGHEVTVVTSPISYLTGKNQAGQNQGKKTEQVSEGIKVIRVKTYRAFHASFFHRLISFLSFMLTSFLASLSVKDVDIVWGTSPPIFQSLTAWIVAFLKRKPFLLEIRDLWPAFAVAVGVLKNPVLIKLSEAAEKFLYHRADRVIVNSPGFVNHVSSNGAQWVELVPNGVDPEMFINFQERKNQLRDSLGFQGKFVFVYAGAHGLSNDLTTLLDAAAVISDPNIHFLFVGDGKEKKRLVEYAEAKKLANVTWYPPVPKNEIGSLFNEVDCGIAILKPIDMYKTTYPNKVFDYMAAGLPVLLVIDGVIRKVIENSDGGVFAQPGNPKEIAEMIQKIASDREHAEQMGKNGRAYVHKHFHRDIFSDQVRVILEEMKKYG